MNGPFYPSAGFGPGQFGQLSTQHSPPGGYGVLTGYFPPQHPPRRASSGSQPQPSVPQPCYNCGVVGHWAQQCMEPRRTRSFGSISSSSTSQQPSFQAASAFTPPISPFSAQGPPQIYPAMSLQYGQTSYGYGPQQQSLLQHHSPPFHQTYMGQTPYPYGQALSPYGQPPSPFGMPGYQQPFPSPPCQQASPTYTAIQPSHHQVSPQLANPGKSNGGLHGHPPHAPGALNNVPISYSPTGGARHPPPQFPPLPSNFGKPKQWVPPPHHKPLNPENFPQANLATQESPAKSTDPASKNPESKKEGQLDPGLAKLPPKPAVSITDVADLENAEPFKTSPQKLQDRSDISPGGMAQDSFMDLFEDLACLRDISERDSQEQISNPAGLVAKPLGILLLTQFPRQPPSESLLMWSEAEHENRCNRHTITTSAKPKLTVPMVIGVRMDDPLLRSVKYPGPLRRLGLNSIVYMLDKRLPSAVNVENRALDENMPPSSSDMIVDTLETAGSDKQDPNRSTGEDTLNAYSKSNPYLGAIFAGSSSARRKSKDELEKDRSYRTRSPLRIPHGPAAQNLRHSNRSNPTKLPIDTEGLASDHRGRDQLSSATNDGRRSASPGRQAQGSAIITESSPLAKTVNRSRKRSAAAVNSAYARR